MQTRPRTVSYTHLGVVAQIEDERLCTLVADQIFQCLFELVIGILVEVGDFDITGPQWKWDEIGMDFIVGLPRTRAGYDSIWVVVDRLTKSAHFIPVKTNYSSAVLAELYMSRIVCLHGVPKKIVSDKGTQFTSHFWQQLHEALGTHLNFSSAYHPQTDGQTERTNQILEDIANRFTIT